MKNLKLIIILFSLVAIASCKNKNKIVANQKPIAVTVATPIVNGQKVVTASGKIEAVQNATLSTRMMGYVNQVYVKVGQKVSKGQLLLKINSSDLVAKKEQINANIVAATTAFNNAKKDYNRFVALFKENSVSQKEMDDMTVNYKMAEAKLNAANEMKKQVVSQLSYANITAPFSGVITGKFIKKGDMANPGIPLIGIEAPGKYQVKILVPETAISSIKNNAPAKVLIKSTHQTVDGNITEISSSSTHTGGLYLVKILLKPTNQKILSGMFTSVQIQVKNTSNGQPNTTILINEKALVKNGQLSGVYTVSNNMAFLRWLQLGNKIGDKIEVLSGLSSDENYILSANSKLYNGATVSIKQ